MKLRLLDLLVFNTITSAVKNTKIFGSENYAIIWGSKMGLPGKSGGHVDLNLIKDTGEPICVFTKLGIFRYRLDMLFIEFENIETKYHSALVSRINSSLNRGAISIRLAPYSTEEGSIIYRLLYTAQINTINLITLRALSKTINRISNELQKVYHTLDEFIEDIKDAESVKSEFYVEPLEPGPNNTEKDNDNSN